ncbi:MAG: nicotinate phosphoribosyltransferase [Acidimicrobiaceae bacterium]|jgi:nicotinate phosphoribosyltransferase|nr:nicotinate phosphoribosyltransferase [Acidimicrobiaceae bacterium]
MTPADKASSARTASIASTALHTDHYELTMLDAAVNDHTADRRATFEVFTRHLPSGANYGVFCGLGRLLDALERFRFGPDELDWLEHAHVVSTATLDWLAGYRFSGDIDAYREGELYGAGSPVLTVDGSFGEAVLLETLILSTFNHDSAVAAAGSRIVAAAGGRPLIEMGSRRTDPDAAVAAARAAYVVGFASTSNLEAGRRYGIPTAGTAAHAFTLAYPTEREAFAAQVAALGPETTLLVDTYDTREGIGNAVAVAGADLGAIRIDSGDLAGEARRARAQLDELGATNTRVIVTGDLDERSLEALAEAPVDGYGVGTAVVMGGDRPTAGFVYKLVAVADEAGDPGTSLRPVAKRSPGKEGVAGRKWAWRLLDGTTGAGDEVAVDPNAPAGPSRPLQVAVVRAGAIVDRPSIEQIRAHHRQARAEWPVGRALEVTLRGHHDG